MGFWKELYSGPSLAQLLDGPLVCAMTEAFSCCNVNDVKVYVRKYRTRISQMVCLGSPVVPTSTSNIRSGIFSYANISS